MTWFLGVGITGVALPILSLAFDGVLEEPPLAYDGPKQQ